MDDNFFLTDWKIFDLPWRELSRRASSPGGPNYTEMKQMQRMTICIEIPIVMDYEKYSAKFGGFSSL